MGFSIVINGAGGTMGGELYELLKGECDFNIIGLSDINVPFKSLKEYEQRFDCVIDFSSPSGLDELLSYALKFKTPVVIGTTGYSRGQYDKIVDASTHIPIYLSPNFSNGVKALTSAVKVIGDNLDNADIGIVEIHKKGKKDMPSGTALRIKEIVEKNIEGKDVDVKSLRMGDTLGEHTVYFTTPYEQVAITHSALSRRCFVIGAISAARFIIQKTNGLYTSTI